MSGPSEPAAPRCEPAQVFVSYSRDDRARALPIIELLEAAGHTIWWDGLLAGGERFARTTEDALENARAVVVLWTRTSIASHWVHDEATRGRDRRVLVPLTLDGVEPPLGFRQFQTIDLSRARVAAGDPAADQLLRAVAALTGDAIPPLRAPARRRGIDRRLLLAGGGAAVLAAGGGAAWWLAGRGAAATANSVAVLPFANLSGDPAQVYFSDGLTAEIRSELARNALLQVAAQASSDKFRASDDARAISRDLRVTYLLDGNVRRAGATVRVSADLIDGGTGFTKWSQSFDRPIADVFAVQDEIAAAVTAALSAQVRRAAGEPAAADTGGTTNVAAYDAYLRGKELFAQGADERSDRAALARFDAAVAADPRYAQAHAARSRTFAVIGNQYAQGTARRADYDAALAAATRAVALAPGLADAHSALGFALLNGKLDARAARAPYDRSAALGGGDADVLSRYALYCVRAGRFDAGRAAAARAAALDPLNARAYRVLAELEYSARRYAESIPLNDRALALNPRMGVARAAKGSAQLLLGQREAALQSYAAEPNTLFALTGLAIAHRRSGRAAAEGALARLRAEHGDNGLYQQAQVLAQWGRTADALATLDRARAAGDAGVMYARNDPFMDPLRGEARFKRLINTLGFS